MISWFSYIWELFVSSWFNIPLSISILVYLISLLIYSKKINIVISRIINIVLVITLFSSAVIGYLQGVIFLGDTQDQLYVICIIVFFATIFIDKVIKNHTKFEKVLIIFFLSIIAYITILKRDISTYLIVVTFLVVILHVSYSILKNINFFIYCNICLIFDQLLFLISDDNRKIILTLSFSALFYILYFIYLIICQVFLIISYLRSKSELPEDKKKLFNERQYDLERIKDYLETYNLIGINSIWGNGKSFLFEKLRQDCKDKYFFICVNVLSMRVEKIETFLLDQINHILEENRIFSNASGKIKSLLKQSFFHNLGELFFGTESYSEQIIELKKDVAKLEKPVVITFEDIDRIDDKKLLYKIFALADSLQCINIKIIFQYEEKKVLSILQVDKIYLEKYLQHTIELTNISFERMIKYMLPYNDEEFLSQKDFNFLIYSINMPFSLQKLLGINKEFKLDIYGFQIRKYELFFEDVQKAIKNPSFRNVENYKKKIILFYFIKHFDYELYGKINDTDSFIQNCTFNYNNNYYTIKDLIKLTTEKVFVNKDLESILNNSENCNHFIYLILLEYDFEQMYSDLQELSKNTSAFNYDAQMIEILTESIQVIKAHQKNDKIDRLFKYLFGAGKSENTDFENAVKEMNEKVLNQPSKKLQEEGYKQLSKVMYYGDFEKADNNTIFRFGISNEFSLFQAYLIYESNIDQWIKLIDFFIHPNEEITSKLIQILNYCKLDDRKILLHIFKIFSSLKVVGNLNDTISYKHFIYNYFYSIMNNGYIRIDKLHWIKNDNSNTLEKEMYLDYIIPDCLEEIKKVPKYTKNAEILNEFSIIKQFIIKNEEIIKANNVLKEFVPEIKTSSTITDQIVEKSKNYRDMNLSQSELQKLLDKQYLNHEINFYEYKCYMENVFSAEK